MSKFIKSEFNYHGGFLTYTDNGQRKVVARFKYRGPVTKAKFLAELIKNHTVEGYFAKMENERMAPLDILRQANRRWYDACLAQFRAKMGR